MIVVDAAAVSSGDSGVRTRLLGLYQAYARLDDAPPVTLRVHPGVGLPNEAFAEGLVELETVHYAGGPWRRMWKATPKQQVQLWHSETLPPRFVGSAASCLTLHDLRWQYHARISGRSRLGIWCRRQYGRVLLTRQLAKIDAVVAVSDATRKDVQRAFDLPAERVVVIENARSLTLTPSSPDELQQWLQQHHVQRPFFLSIGHLEPRKNWQLILQALQQAPKLARQIQWLLIGRGAQYAELDQRVTAAGLGDTVRLVQWQPSAIVHGLLQRALALLQPSRIEGFGIPVAEAFSAGCPVVALPLSCYEAWHTDGFWRCPDDVAEWARAMQRIHQDRQEWRTAAARQQKAFRDHTWQKAARQLADLYLRLSVRSR